MAEDDRVGVGEAFAQPLRATVARPGVVDHGDPRALRLDHAGLGQQRAHLGLVDVAPHADHRRVQLERAQHREREEVAAWRIRSLRLRTRTHESGSVRSPLGMWVSARTAINTAGDAS